METTNWDILKFKYEVIGVSLEALSLDTGISLPLIKRNAANWKQLSLVEDDGDSALSAAERSSKIQSIMKQKILSEKYVELEMLLLYKAIAVTNNLTDSADQGNILALKNLTSVLSELLSNNPALTPAKQDDKVVNPNDTKWEINVITAGGVQENKTIQLKQ